MYKVPLTAVGLVVCNSIHAASIVFADNFDANDVGLNAAPTGWVVIDGTVDIIGNGFDDYIPGSGVYVDLDGTSYDAGILSTTVGLITGVQYVALFDLAGNQRNPSPESVRVYFGNALGDFGLSQSTGWTQFSLSYTPAISGTYTLSFASAGNDSVGMLLDNVSVLAVPEPTTFSMLLAGLGLFGLHSRRFG